jgi:nicotinamidase/pyrazinamidase
MAQFISLLVIDPQRDFCGDQPAGEYKPTLGVPGGWADMVRLGTMLDRTYMQIDAIHVTLDSHPLVHIAHPGWWMDAQGSEPGPFTIIKAADVAAGVWTPRNPKLRQYSLDYVRTLEAKKNFDLCIWPVHCQIGMEGSNVQPDLMASLNGWAGKRNRWVNFVTKGSNPMTEHYSAIAAEVPDPRDPQTMLNTRLIDELRKSDIVLIAGEALSHCVRTTVSDIADNIGAEHVRKLVLLEDCTSAIPAIPGGGPACDYPAIAAAFVRDMQARGMHVARSTEFLR